MNAAGITIRPAEPADAGTWARLRAALWPDDPLEHEADVARFFGGHRHEPAEVLVAVGADVAVVGFAELSLRSIADGCATTPVGYLEGWYVAPEHRHRGIGAALVHAAWDWARARGCTEFASDALLDNAGSQAAHAALGFQEVSRVVTFRRSL